jgi:hypothetical protein
MDRTHPAADVHDVRRVARANVRAAASTGQPARRAVAVRRLLAGATLALALTCGLTVAPAARAAAVAGTVQPGPVVVVAATSTVTATVTVAATAATTAHGGRIVVVWAPVPAGLRQVGAGVTGAGRGTLVTTRIRVATPMLRAGLQTWWLQDLGDASWAPMLVRVVRPSRVGVPALVSTGDGGAVVGAVRVTHRDLVTGRQMASQQSPVQMQVVAGGRWVTAATWTTDRAGEAYGVMRLPAGIWLVRALRPAGDTVAPAVSRAVRVEVIPGYDSAAVPA